MQSITSPLEVIEVEWKDLTLDQLHEYLKEAEAISIEGEINDVLFYMEDIRTMVYIPIKLTSTMTATEDLMGEEKRTDIQGLHETIEQIFLPKQQIQIIYSKPH